MKEELVQLEVNATHRYYLVLEKLGTPAPQIDPRLEHILVTGLMNAYFEMHHPRYAAGRCTAVSA